jgi:restriction system protein
MLDQFSEFREWRAQSRLNGIDGQKSSTPSAKLQIDSNQTPEDSISQAYSLLNASLRDELLDLLYSMTPARFERLILDLLGKMGFGGGNVKNAKMTKTIGDGGIDGIIDEDALGLDAVYIQAKRYNSDYKVGRPDLQKFVGSLTGEGAAKGVFITTSDFSRDAVEYVTRVQHRIRLVNGQELADLMIRYEVGVRSRLTYVIRSVDEDYFADSEAK